MINKVEEAVKTNGYKMRCPLSRDNFGRYHGVLEDASGQVFFLKAVDNTWSYSYKSLLAECYVTRYLAEQTVNTEIWQDGYRLLVPTVKEIINRHGVLCLITEYIAGRRLDEQPPTEQACVLGVTLDLINTLGDRIPLDAIRPYLKAYTTAALFTHVLLRLAKAVLLTPTMILELLVVAYRALSVIRLPSEQRLVHADVNAGNVITDGTRIFLTDWEEAGYGLSDYTLTTPLSVHWTNTVIRDILLQRTVGKWGRVLPLMAYRTLVLLNQNIPAGDIRRVRDLCLLNCITDCSDDK